MSIYSDNSGTNTTSWVKVGDYVFHPQCFKCSTCDAVIDSKSKYHKSDDGFLCIPCTKEMNPEVQIVDENVKPDACHACKNEISSGWVTDADNNSYHPECFICAECGMLLGGGGQQYSKVDDAVFCVECRNAQLNG